MTAPHPPSPAELAFLALLADPPAYRAWAKATRTAWLQSARGRDALAAYKRWEKTRPTPKAAA
jgi:hypothetical protein